MNDKLLHMIIGFVIGVVTFICYFALTRSLKLSIVSGIAIGLCVGGFKEIIDGYSGTGSVEMLDILATGVGSSIGSSVTALIYLYKD